MEGLRCPEALKRWKEAIAEIEQRRENIQQLLKTKTELERQSEESD